MFKLYRNLVEYLDAAADEKRFFLRREACYAAIAYAQEQAAKCTHNNIQTTPEDRMKFALEYLNFVYPELENKQAHIESIYAKLVGVGMTGGQKV